MINLNDYLTGGIYVAHSHIKSRAEWQYEGIISSPKRKEDMRTNDQIWNHTYNSIACEIGISEALPDSKLNEQKFNYKDITTWGYDVSAFDLKILFEIKWQHMLESWYSFTNQTATKIIDRYRKKGYHYLITASTREYGDGLEIWPRLLIDPKTFRNHVKRSHYNKKPLFYNQYPAQRDNQCQIFNKNIIEKIQISEKSCLQSYETVV